MGMLAQSCQEPLNCTEALVRVVPRNPPAPEVIREAKRRERDEPRFAGDVVEIGAVAGESMAAAEESVNAGNGALKIWNDPHAVTRCEVPDPKDATAVYHNLSRP